MSSSIGSISQLVTVIRSQLAVSVPVAPGKAAAAPVRKRTGKYADKNLSTLIELRIGQINPDDPQRGRKAFRVFLEVVLLSQFGEQMVNDPKFHQLIDDVQTAMEADPVSGPMVGTAIEHLLSRKP